MSEQIPVEPAPMVRATDPYLGPPHGAVRVAGGAFKNSRVPAQQFF
jgi:hypothetical protein